MVLSTLIVHHKVSFRHQEYNLLQAIVPNQKVPFHQASSNNVATYRNMEAILWALFLIRLTLRRLFKTLYLSTWMDLHSLTNKFK